MFGAASSNHIDISCDQLINGGPSSIEVYEQRQKCRIDFEAIDNNAQIGFVAQIRSLALCTHLLDAFLTQRKIVTLHQTRKQKCFQRVARHTSCEGVK